MDDGLGWGSDVLEDHPQGAHWRRPEAGGQMAHLEDKVDGHSDREEQEHDPDKGCLETEGPERRTLVVKALEKVTLMVKALGQVTLWRVVR